MTYLTSFHHDPYKVPYQPPPWNKKEPGFMLFNDDERRFYYEGIPVPDTEEFMDMTKEQQTQARYERIGGLVRRAQEPEEPRVKEDKLERPTKSCKTLSTRKLPTKPKAKPLLQLFRSSSRRKSTVTNRALER